MKWIIMKINDDNCRNFNHLKEALVEMRNWVTTSAVQPTFWDSDSFNIKWLGRHWHPKGATLAEGRPGTLSCKSALGSHQGGGGGLNFCVYSTPLRKRNAQKRLSK